MVPAGLGERAMRLLCGALACAVLTLAVAAGVREGQERAGATEPHVVKLAPHLLRIGKAVVDSKERIVRLRGRVSAGSDMPIELLACLPRGKAYESVLTIDVDPKDFQVALLLLGMKPGRNPAVKYAKDAPELRRPPGDQARIFVTWKAEQKGNPPQRHRAEELLYNVQADTPAQRANWVFLGSRFVNGTFGADLDGTLITTYHDPVAIMELAAETVNDDIYYVVRKDVCPPAGTPVTLEVQPVAGRKADAHTGQDEQTEPKSPAAEEREECSPGT